MHTYFSNTNHYKTFTLPFNTFLFLSIQAEEVPDSLLTESYIQHIHLRNPQRALQLLNLAEQRQLPNLPSFRIHRLVTALKMQGKYEESIRLCKETIDLARQINNLVMEGKHIYRVMCLFRYESAG